MYECSDVLGAWVSLEYCWRDNNQCALMIYFLFHTTCCWINLFRFKYSVLSSDFVVRSMDI